MTPPWVLFEHKHGERSLFVGDDGEHPYETLIRGMADAAMTRGHTPVSAEMTVRDYTMVVNRAVGGLFGRELHVFGCFGKTVVRWMRE